MDFIQPCQDVLAVHCEQPLAAWHHCRLWGFLEFYWQHPRSLRKSTHWVVYRARRCSHSSLWFSHSCLMTRVGLLPSPHSRRSRMTRISQAYLRKSKIHTFIYFTYLICKVFAKICDEGLSTDVEWKYTYFRVRMTRNSERWPRSSCCRTVWLQDTCEALHLVQMRVSVTMLYILSMSRTCRALLCRPPPVSWCCPQAGLGQRTLTLHSLYGIHSKSAWQKNLSGAGAWLYVSAGCGG